MTIEENKNDVYQAVKRACEKANRSSEYQLYKLVIPGELHKRHILGNHPVNLGEI